MIILNNKDIKVLASKTKLRILKVLQQKPRTLSELARVLKLKESTVKQHIDEMLKCNFIEKENTKRKWKYYYLTSKGLNIIDPKEKTFKLVLFIETLVAISLGIWNLIKWIKEKLQSSQIASSTSRGGIKAYKIELTTNETIFKGFHFNTYHALIIVIACLIVTLLLYSRYHKSHTLKIKKEVK